MIPVGVYRYIPGMRQLLSHEERRSALISSTEIAILSAQFKSPFSLLVPMLKSKKISGVLPKKAVANITPVPVRVT
jgi:hypothetical protein